ncbi:hypothetical protein GobsT_50080 [Gemmata obscuriglobus]|nr:hypothetical protein GobsT_50080 [Gemmata obscuriglobus]VTS09529.1 unnamed protein product [Gemmata obscuriglobus UQM 2246]
MNYFKCYWCGWSPLKALRFVQVRFACPKCGGEE